MHPRPPLWRLVFGLLLALCAVPARAKRIALVIGNDSHPNVQTLKNAGADAKATAAELKIVGFDVTLNHDLT